MGGGGEGAPLADLVLKSQLMIWLYDMILEYFTTNNGYTANLTTNLGIFFCCKTIAKAVISDKNIWTISTQIGVATSISILQKIWKFNYKMIFVY